jgi:hypothetical protein
MAAKPKSYNENLISFRGADLKAKLLASGPVAAEGPKALNRYFNLLAYAAQSISLSQKEALLLCDLLNGTMFGNFEISPRTLRAELEDGYLYSKLDEKWGVDGDAFLEKISGYNETQCAAVIRATEVFWESPDGRIEDMNVKVREAFGQMIREPKADEEV